MSNQPKITYRSDTTGLLYQMMQRGNKTFDINAVFMDDSGRGMISPTYACQFPWRLTINYFFDIVTNHINTGEWMP